MIYGDSFYESNRARLDKLMDSLDWEHSSLKDDFASYQSLKEKSVALVEYYRNRDVEVGLLPKPLFFDADVQIRATLALENKFSVQGIIAKQALMPNGNVDWDYKGPKDDQEWAWVMNRHDYFSDLMSIWRKTERSEFLELIDLHLKDWVVANPVPNHMSFSSAWRALEVARRFLGPWTDVFWGLENEKELSDEARILFLSSIPEHANYLMKHHSFFGNHLVTEMTALANIALIWPEFKASEEWLEFATEKIMTELYAQTYPDGSYKELSNHYQRVALLSFQKAYDLYRVSGHDEVALKIRNRLEPMWDYFVGVMKPDGSGPLNNDADVEHNETFIKAILHKYDRPDWLYAVNKSKSGISQVGVPSRYYEWAGQAIMRNGWDENAHWAYFEMGPHGSDHQHWDRLHLSLSIGTRNFLVDTGRYHYKRDKWRDYFRGGQSHNVLLLDGQSTMPMQNEIVEPLPVISETTPLFDYFSAKSYFASDALKGKGRSSHQRSVFYVRGKYWLVIDQVKTFGEKKLKALWHFIYDCPVYLDDGKTWTAYSKGMNLRIVPVGHKEKWKANIISGQEKPHVQGWYSKDYNIKYPAPVSVYEKTISQPETFVWLIYAEDVKVKRLAIRAKVLEQSEKLIKVSVMFEGTEELIVIEPNKRELILK